jgi:hypothetical protein
MHYLIIDSTMPEPYGKFIWSPRMESATPFSSLGDANAVRSAVPDATGVIEAGGAWYVVKDPK